MMRPQTSKCRRGFTLLETVMAAAIGSLVVLACLGMFYAMNRTDRALDTRAKEQGELERLRKVMERSFSTLLMSDEPHTPKPGDPNAATPADAAKGGDATGAATNTPGTSNTTAPTAAITTNRTTSSAASSSTTGTDKTTGTDAKDADAKAKAMRLPPPPRMVLSLGTGDASVTMAHHPGPGQPLENAGVPQRLELVLFQAPVPTVQADPFAEALPSRWTRSRTEAQTKKKDSTDKKTDTSAGDKAVADQATADLASMPVRAVRGAFEVYPQPPKHPGVDVVPVGLQPGVQPTGLWQVWWIPLPRLNLDGTMFVTDDDPNVEPPRPYLVASDLRFVRWTVFHERARQNELSSIWSSDLPAYVEVEAETASGQAVNWMFEIDWANGPEVPKAATKPGTDTTKAQNQPAAQPLQPANATGTRSKGAQ
jgi:prepilin-type N-terminal cleavage/methylation domain-containing protein